jgi:hypothetical protein
MLREAGYSSDPRQGIEGEKPRQPGDLAVARVRKRLLDIKSVEFLENFVSNNWSNRDVLQEKEG